MIVLTFCFAYIIRAAICIPIDNGVHGTPNVKCQMDRIFIQVPTQKPFLGRVFVKGQSKRAECAKDFLNNSLPLAEIDLRLSSCGMKRERKLAPQPGLEQTVTLIVSFHYVFVTKVDKAYSIDCFYGEQNFAKVTHNVNVSMIPTEQLFPNEGLQPDCVYEVRKNGLDGPPAVYAEVGDKLFHRWTCAADERMKFLVKSCSVTDGNGELFTIVDDRGCAVDPVVLTDLTYDLENNFAFVESHAFKFADTAFLGFSCTIQVCSLDKDPTCDSLSPPICSVDGQPYGIVQSSRKKSRDEPLPLLRDEVDVSAPAMNILESGLYLRQRPHTESRSHQRFPDELARDMLSPHYHKRNHDKVPYYAIPSYLIPTEPSLNTGGQKDAVCLKKFVFGVLTIVLFGLIITLGIVCIVLYVSLRKAKPEPGIDWWMTQSTM